MTDNECYYLLFGSVCVSVALHLLFDWIKERGRG